MGLEADSRLDQGVEVLKDILVSDTNLGGKMDSMLDKQDAMLDKQDDLLNEVSDAGMISRAIWAKDSSVSKSMWLR